MALVSIVIPIYNVEKYLKEALESVINQTYKNLEIILVNDGSTDNSGKIARNYEKLDKRVSVINQVNQGLSEARNVGLKKSTGKYIYFFDSDDILEVTAIEKCYKLASLKNLDLVIFGASSFEDETRNSIDPQKYLLKGEVEEELVYSGEKFLEEKLYIAPVWTKFIRRKILIKNNLFFYKGMLHEDELFTPILLSLVERVSYIDEIFFQRRIRKGSIMNSKVTHRNIDGYLIALKKLTEIEFTLECSSKINSLIRKRLINNIIYLSLKHLKTTKYLKLIKEEYIKYCTYREKFKLFLPHCFLLLKNIKEKIIKI